MAGGRLLITGSNGFTGRYAAAEFEAAGWEVWGTGNSPMPGDASYRQANIHDPEEMRSVLAEIRPDAVLHLAAVAFVSHGSIVDFYDVNLVGTRNLLQVLADAELGQAGVILASSANIYGNAETLPISEFTEPAPENDYAVSKLAMEYVARLFHDRLPLTIVRPFNYTGVGQDPKFLVPKIVSHFRRRAPRIELGNVDVARDFSDVRDVVRAYRGLLDAGPRGETFNICSGKATTLDEILRICMDVTGHDIEIVHNPDLVRAREVKVLVGDPGRLESLLGPLERRDLKTTLSWMLESD